MLPAFTIISVDLAMAPLVDHKTSWGGIGGFLGRPGESWGRLGIVLERLGIVLGAFGGGQGCLGSRLDRLVFVLGTSWSVSGPSCDVFHVGTCPT